MPMSAPTIAPDIDTVRARYPAHATIALTPMAHGRAAAIVRSDASRAAGVIRLANHRTAPAVAGTETLSSSRTGIVSTSAATMAAASGATISNCHDGSGAIAGRVQQASATAPSPPHTAKAIVPAIVFS